MQPQNSTGASGQVGVPVILSQVPGIGIIQAYDYQAPPASGAGYAPGAIFSDIANGIVYTNTGSSTSATWVAFANGNIASSSQDALGAVTTIGSNTSSSQAGLSLIGNTTTVNQATNIMNDFASLREDIAAAFTLINALRAALVSAEVIKGSA